MTRRTRVPAALRAGVALFVLASAMPTAAADGLLHRWHFHPRFHNDQTIQAVTGDRHATVVGPVHFSKDSPAALLLDGNAKSRHHVAVTTDLAQIELPKRTISVEAWLLVDKPLEWGGICGVVQDNGDYERGWILGYRKSNFFFAVASETKKRLTYLTDPRAFETGYWYHVVGTYDGREQRLYVDGKLRATSQQQSGPIAYPPSGFFTIGAYHDDNEFHPLTGRIERVSVYGNSLAAAEIASRFRARLSEFPEIEAVAPDVVDWPTYLRDNQRTGISQETIPFPLHLKWVYHARHPPRPAWPAPAKQNFWHKKYNLKPRVTYDRAYHVVCVGDAAYFASSSDDKVYCLDADTGSQRWSFFAQGPVRLAPTIAAGKVLFGSDDGWAYCLDAESGSLIWKYRLEEAADRQIPGNGRVMSATPIRTGVLVDENTALFCVGLFPNQGVFQAAVDIRTGRKIGSGRIQVAAQGYLERKGGRLYSPAGRNPAGAFVAQLKRRGKGVGKELRQLPAAYPYAFIGAKGVRFGGGDGTVAAFAIEDGRQLWSASIQGKAYGLSIAGGRLFVSTDQGLIYCFDSTNGTPRDVTPAPKRPMVYPNEETAQRYKSAAEKILSTSKVRRGYCLVLGSDRGYLAYELARQSDLKVVCVEVDAAKVAASRQHLDDAGMYGRVVVHHRSPDDDLPYTDYMFNLVVSDAIAVDQAPRGKRAEILRVLRPGGGIAFFGPEPTDVVRRAPLEGIGQWSHMYANPANTACSTDQRVRGTMALQWFGRPGPRQMIDRHHRTVAPLWKNGRLFVPGDNRVFGADAYNGTPLWSVEIPNSRRVAVLRDCGYMAAGDRRLYVAADDRCLALDAETGQTEHTFRVPRANGGPKRDWGFVAIVEGRLLGSGVKPGASRRSHDLKSISEGAYFDFRELVCSDFVFSFDAQDTTHRWTYRSDAGAIVNSTITIGDDKAYFVESRNPQTLENPKGRHQLSTLLGQGADLVAIDLRTGKVVWRTPGEFGNARHNLYASFANNRVVVVGSRNNGTNREKSRVLFDIHAFDAGSGTALWQATQQQPTKIGGSHGEQDLHPVIVGDRLYCEPYAYDLHTGKRIADWGWNLGKRSGCGTISASASTLFFRHSNPTRFDLKTMKRFPVTTSTRPGCWINIIPAGGLLLIPEASSGCTCNFAVQTSLAFLPMVGP